MSNEVTKNILLLFSNQSQFENMIIQECKSGYTSGDVFAIHSMDTANWEALPKEMPFFSSKYLLLVYCRKLSTEDYKLLVRYVNKLDYYNICLIVYSREIFEKLSIDFPLANTINLYTPEEKLVNQYLNSKLACKLDIAAYEFFWKRMRRQWKYIDEYILQLNAYADNLALSGNIDISDVYLKVKDLNKLIPKVEHLDLLALALDVLEGNPLQHHIKILANFKYADKYLYKEFETKLNLLISIKKQIILGNLVNTNLIEYSKVKHINYNDLDLIYTFISLPSTKLEYLCKVKRLYTSNYKNDLLGFILDQNISGIVNKKIERRLAGE